MCTTKRFLLLPGAVLYAAVAMATKRKHMLGWLALGIAGVALGSFVNTTVFELDGDATDTSTSGDDWSTVFGCTTAKVCASTAGGSALQGTGLTADIGGAGDNILTGGHTKDIYDFGVWQWKQTATTSVQDKDDILHSGAAAYTDPSNGHTLIYFMADRFDNSGDSQMGFWFVQDPNVGIAGSGSSGTFTGHHKEGDI